MSAFSIDSNNAYADPYEYEPEPAAPEVQPQILPSGDVEPSSLVDLGNVAVVYPPDATELQQDRRERLFAPIAEWITGQIDVAGTTTEYIAPVDPFVFDSLGEFHVTLPGVAEALTYPASTPPSVVVADARSVWTEAELEAAFGVPVERNFDETAGYIYTFTPERTPSPLGTQPQGVTVNGDGSVRVTGEANQAAFAGANELRNQIYIGMNPTVPTPESFVEVGRFITAAMIQDALRAPLPEIVVQYNPARGANGEYQGHLPRLAEPWVFDARSEPTQVIAGVLACYARAAPWADGGAA